MNSAFRAIWLVPQSRDIKYYPPPGGFRVKKMSCVTLFIRKWSNFLGIAIKLVLYILKQLFASVSVTSDGYLPRRSGSVNIQYYSPPLLRIIVKYTVYIFAYKEMYILQQCWGRQVMSKVVNEPLVIWGSFSANPQGNLRFRTFWAAAPSPCSSLFT